jgi:hypothetical protein
MQRFRKYVDKSLNLGNVKNSNQLAAFGIICTSLPDPPEEFDEFEFNTGYSEQMDVVMGVAIELGKIKRVLFGLSDKNDPDMFKGMSESQLEEFLALKGDQLVGFFEYITQ